MADHILTTGSIREYFDHAVDTALRQHGVSPGRATSAYLVNLLCEFLTRSVNDLDQPLGPLLARTGRQDPHQRIDDLKRVGDDALYLLGFFQEHLRRRDLDVGYFQTLGGTAYQRLSVLLRRRSGHTQLVTVFRELSSEFPQFTEVLAEVRLQQAGDDDVGGLYERWLDSGSTAVARGLRLAKMVDLPPVGDGSKN